MLTKRIIPCLDVEAGRVVKGRKFRNLEDAGDPVELAKVYASSGADELVFLDISASSENRETVTQMVKQVAKEIFIPFTVGGGIRSVENMRNILLSGADKVAMNTMAVKNPRIIQEGSRTFGNQCIVVAIDAKRKGSSWEVYINGGKTPTGIDAISWAKKVAMLGAGELLITSIDHDGTRAGFDLNLTRTVSKAVNVPVIASGGAGSRDDFYDVMTTGHADAVLAASLFHYGDMTIKELKKYLSNKGINIRK